MAHWDFEHRPSVQEAIRWTFNQWSHDPQSDHHDPRKWEIRSYTYSWRGGIHAGKDCGYITVWFVGFREVTDPVELTFRDFVKFAASKKKECEAWLRDQISAYAEIQP